MSLIHDHAGEHSDDIVAKPGAEQDALGPLLAYQSAWNLRDISGMKATFHFPHVRIASGRIRVLEENTAFPTSFLVLSLKLQGGTTVFGIIVMRFRARPTKSTLPYNLPATESTIRL